MTKDEQEAYIDEQLQIYKTQMMKMPNTIPVLVLASTWVPGGGGKMSVFVNSLFKVHWMEMLSRIMRGDSPLETNLFTTDDPRGWEGNKGGG